MGPENTSRSAEERRQRVDFYFYLSAFLAVALVLALWGEYGPKAGIYAALEGCSSFGMSALCLKRPGA